MRKFYPKNERIKKSYIQFIKEADGKSEGTVIAVLKSIDRYEKHTKYQDFGTFNKEKAIAFKKHLTGQNNKYGQLLSKSTLLHTVKQVQAFFRWVAYQPGYKSKISVPEINYLNLTDKDIRTAQAITLKGWPTIDQIGHVVQNMPYETEIEKRNRALIAFTVLTGIRDNAIASLKLRNIDIVEGMVNQTPNDVQTKFSKQIFTWFFPVGDDFKQIVVDWVKYLYEDKLFSGTDPLFPRNQKTHDNNHCFTYDGIEPIPWQSASRIREIFKQAFERAGLPYFNPHSFRKTLTDYGQRECQTPEQFKAWSQNLGHENVLTTFTSYGNLEPQRQGEVIKALQNNPKNNNDLSKLDAKLDLLLERRSI